MRAFFDRRFFERLTTPSGLAALFLSSALLVLIISPLFQKGSFIDAMLYKTVALNLANGEGDFWSMKYTNTSMTFFCEQPPLYMHSLGMVYQLFGSGYLADRFFTLVQCLLFLVFLFRICRKLFTPSFPFFLLNLFLILSIQAVCWSFANQVIETLVLTLVAAAVDLYLSFLTDKKWKWFIWFGIVVLALFLTKGFQSCFVIVLPWTYALLHLKKEKILWFAFFTSLLLLVSILLMVFVYEPAKQWFTCYYQARLVLTMNNVGSTTDKHYTILLQFLMETIVVWLSLAVLLIVAANKGFSWKEEVGNVFSNKLALCLGLTCMAGSLPFALSLVQRGFYLVPSYLLFVLFITYGFRSQWSLFLAQLAGYANRLWIKILMPLLFVSAGFYFLLNLGTYKREEALAKDLELMTPLLPQGATVGINSNVWNYFNLHSSLYMQKKISLSADPERTGFVIVYKNEKPVAGDLFLYKVDWPTQELDLYYRAEKRTLPKN